MIHNGIDLDAFTYTESMFREKYCIPEDKKIELMMSISRGTYVYRGLTNFGRESIYEASSDVIAVVL